MMADSNDGVQRVWQSMKRGAVALRRDRLTLWLAATCVLLLAGVVTFGVLTGVNYGYAVEAQRERDVNASEIDALKEKADGLQKEVDRYYPVFQKAWNVDADARIVEQRESDVAAREAAAGETEAQLAAREEAVKAREAAATSNASGDWWIERVRECLSRSGDYRAATVTAGSLGRDLTCYTG